MFIEDLYNKLLKHKAILNKWPESHPSFAAISEIIAKFENLKLKEITFSSWMELERALSPYYTKFWSEKQLVPKDIIDGWLKRAMGCKTSSCAGRWYSGGDKPLPAEYYGHEVVIQGYGSLHISLQNLDGENMRILPSEIAKIKPTPMEDFALAVEGYSLYIAPKPSVYYRSDY